MRGRKLFAALFLVLLASMPALPALASGLFQANATLTFLGTFGGQQRYRYDYAVKNLNDPLGLTSYSVFFNSSPFAPFGPSGNKATLVSVSSPGGWDPTVIGKNAQGQWSVTWDWDFATPVPGYIPLGGTLSGFSVVFDWNSTTSLPSIQHAQARNGQSDSDTTHVNTSISGNVSSACGGSVALEGVTIDLYIVINGLDVFVGTTTTGPDGGYEFDALPLAQYRVVIVTPLGYTATPSIQNVGLGPENFDLVANFPLGCRPDGSGALTIGYWKHQFNVYLTGKGKAQESLTSLINYIDLIVLHFNDNALNPVVVYNPGAPGSTLTKLDELLTVNKGGTMLDRAKQQLIALLFNTVSGKILQTDVVSADGATLSQAITYCSELIDDGDPANDETAKTIADTINNGQIVPAGVIPVSTPIITYRNPAPQTTVAFGLALPAPNPARGGMTSVSYATTRSGQVSLRIFDAQGRTVRTLVQGELAAGAHQAVWDGSDDRGAQVGAGVYYYRLFTPEGMRTRSIAVVR